LRKINSWTPFKNLTPPNPIDPLGCGRAASRPQQNASPNIIHSACLALMKLRPIASSDDTIRNVNELGGRADDRPARFLA